MLPPVDADFLRFVHRRDQEPDLNCQQFDIEQVDLDIPGDHNAAVQDTLEDIGEICPFPFGGLTGLARGRSSA